MCVPLTVCRTHCQVRCWDETDQAESRTVNQPPPHPNGFDTGSIEPKGKHGHHALLSMRLELLISGLITGGIVMALFLALIKPELDHQKWYCRVQESIKNLSTRTPPGVSREQWDLAVEWTLNAHANCCGRREYLKTLEEPEARRFAVELDHGLRGPVDLKTIGWIWDEFERISKHGKMYSDEWRPDRGVHQR